MPWFQILMICLGFSWAAIHILELNTLLAPVLKFITLSKTLFLKTLPALLILTWTTLSSLATELVALIATIASGWKMWSAKKMVRHVARFAATTSARFVLISVVLNLLFGKERKGIKQLPGHLLSTLKNTWIGRLYRRFSQTSDRTRRLVTGIALAIVFILLGHALIGFTILLFDLVWELVLWIIRALSNAWRWASPWLLRLVPNFIGNYFTKKIIPMISEVVPVIRDDHRVLYMRFNLRMHYRRFKYLIYRQSRIRRKRVRKRVSTVVSDNMRLRKERLLDSATKVVKKSRQNDEG